MWFWFICFVVWVLLLLFFLTNSNRISHINTIILFFIISCSFMPICNNIAQFYSHCLNIDVTTLNIDVITLMLLR